MELSIALKKEFAGFLLSAVKSSYREASLSEEQIIVTIKYEDSAHGDISSSVAFLLAKQLKKNPHEIAAELSRKITRSGFISSATDVSGYINARINRSAYSESVIDAINEQRDHYGHSGIGEGVKVIVESPSVNPNKPWHIGHLRNAVLGDVISNILTACRYRVEREDYIDDLGLQVAESFWGYTNINDKPDKKFDQWLGEQYVLVNKKLEADTAIAAQINELLKRMEVKGSKEAEMAREISERCVIAQYDTAFNYGISHDVLIWESDIVNENILGKALSIADRKGLLERPGSGKYAGCVIMKLEKAKELAKDFESPSEDAKVLIRSNGTATYVAKDLAFHMWKFGIVEGNFKYKKFLEMQANGKRLFSTSPSGSAGEFGKAKIVVNIIDEKQRYPQLILRAAFGLMGYGDISESIIHLSYGAVGVEGGSLSGRKGGWLGSDGRAYTADSLLQEATNKAAKIVGESNKITDKSKIPEISRGVALGAIKFDFLRIAPEKGVLFSWEKALRFEGDTGPYCMYTYARATRLLEKAGSKRSKLGGRDYSSIGDDEFRLVKLLGMAQEMVIKAANEHRPNVLTDYLIDIATLFSRFYESTPVIGSGESEKFRLELVSSARQVIGNVLRLLGIPPIERM